MYQWGIAAAWRRGVSALRAINGTPIKLVRPFSSFGM